MKFTRLSAFIVGALLATAVTGTATYIYASNSQTITACVNQKTGVMRYLEKGRCRKGEKTVRWNQLGPKGDPGASGPAGASGSSGISTRQITAVDFEGKTLGPVIGHDSNHVEVMIDNIVWRLSKFDKIVIGVAPSPVVYQDSSCNKPLYIQDNGYSVPNQSVFIDFGIDGDLGENDLAYRPLSTQIVREGLIVYHWTNSWPVGSEYTGLVECRARDELPPGRVHLTEQVSKPTYVPPIQIVLQ